MLGADGIAFVQGPDSLSWGALDRASTEMAWALKARGVGQDDFVTVALPNGGAFYIATFAIWKAGATPHVVSWKLPEAEFHEILELLRPKLVIAAYPSQGTAHPSVTPAELQSGRHEDLPLLTATCWKAMSSGGSTGRPKIIVDHTPAEFDPDQAALKLPSRGVVLNPGPLYHNAPFVVTHYALFRGNRVVGMERFDPEAALRLIDAQQVGWVSMVPTMMARIWRLPPEVRESFDLSSLETVWHMAAPMPVWLKKAWIDWLGAEKIWELYAGTERTGRTTIGGVDWLSHPGSVGRPDPDCFVEIRDEAGARLPPGAVGEIYFGRRDPARPYHYIGA
ncbi:MAG: AMP-binding protein, partial [Proteobacteria bacterium]|nr:AMP-binding protein [Pseudomonadota bacterium]